MSERCVDIFSSSTLAYESMLGDVAQTYFVYDMYT